MNGKDSVVVKQKDDYLEHVPRSVGSNDQDLRGVGVRIEVDHSERMLDRM